MQSRRPVILMKLEMNMNRNIAIAFLAVAAAAGNAFADDITVETDSFTSTRSRAEVQAELAQYKKSGVNPWSTSYNQLRGFQSTKSRAEVVGDYLVARNQVAATTGEDSGSAVLALSRPVQGGSWLVGQAR